MGRFITPDTIVQSPGNPQTLNRYTYCNNNPVNLVDLDGHKWSWKKFWKGVGVAIAGAVLFFTAPYLLPTLGPFMMGVMQGAIAGAAIGGFSAGVTGGNIGQGLLTGAISGAIFGGIGGLGLEGLAHTGAHFAGGAASGAIDGAITGGDIGMGALVGGLSAGVGEWAGGNIKAFKLTGNYMTDVVKRAALGGLIGGTTSSAFGGNFGSGFVNGAKMSAIGYTANSFVHDYAPAITNGILTGASAIPGWIGAGARVVRTVLSALSVGVSVIQSSADERLGVPTGKDGFKPARNWNGQKVRNPNGSGSGYPAKNGDVWIPTDHKGTHAPHWDVQHPDGGYTDIYPKGD